MKFTPTSLAGAQLISPDLLCDERGFFARTWCQEEFDRHGLNVQLVQCNISFGKQTGTLRGMHYQVAPHAETKLVRCTAGAVCDVIIDLRPDSPTYKQWQAFELTAENRKMLYVPVDFAHGFQTLTENTEVFYQATAPYRRESERGLRWNDPTFGIQWPLPITEISDKDRGHPNFRGPVPLGSLP